MNRFEILIGGIFAAVLLFAPAGLFFAGRAALVHFGWITP